MFTQRNFWYGFLIAYLVAVFFPPQRLMAAGRKKQG